MALQEPKGFWYGGEYPNVQYMEVPPEIEITRIVIFNGKVYEHIARIWFNGYSEGEYHQLRDDNHCNLRIEWLRKQKEIQAQKDWESLPF